MLKRIFLIISVISILIGAFCLAVNSEESITAPGGEVRNSDELFTALGGEDAALKKDGAILLLYDIVLESPVKLLTGEYTILGSGGTITADFDDSSFIILGEETASDDASKVKLTIGSEKENNSQDNLIFDGKNEQIGGSFIRVSKNSELIIYGGTVFQNATVDGSGAAVYNEGSFNFFGGTAEKLVSSECGGAFYNEGTMFLAGGDVTECRSELGGAVYTKNNDTEGGLYLIGTEIIECEAEKGGAVYNTGKLSFVSSSVYNCKATDGGAVYNAEGASVEFLGGQVTDSSASRNGGAIFNKGTISIGSKNSEQEVGTYFEVNDAINGGNVYNDSGELNIFGGYVCLGTAEANGGNVYNNTGKVLVAGGTIGSGKATYGGGIFNKGELTVSGGGFYTCKAEAGAAILNDGKMTFVEYPYIAAGNDVFITVKADNSSAINIASEMKAECVATLTPGIKDGENYTVKYSEGDMLIAGEYSEESHLRFSITESGKDEWLLTGNGRLEKTPPVYNSVWFYVVIFAAFIVTVAVMVGVILLFDKIRSKKNISA